MKNILGRMEGRKEVKQYTTHSGGAWVQIQVSYDYIKKKIYSHVRIGLFMYARCFVIIFAKVACNMHKSE